jgi:hypothetical protein
MRYWITVAIMLYAALGCASNSSAGEKEQAVAASCAASSADGYTYAACVAAGLTANEIKTCETTPTKCFGENNEFRKYLCAVGLGCPKKDYVNDLKRIMPYRNGCIAIFRSGVYWSPDCENLRGGGNTVNAWKVDEPHSDLILGMVILDDCVITAFSGGGIYRSCNGQNLGGGGQTEKLYEGRPVSTMSVAPGGLRTVFNDGSCYLDPSGKHPGGGPGVSHCN